MSEYSFITLNILALAKVILFTFFVLFLFILYKRNKPWHHLLLFGGSIFLFYLVLSYPLQRMWWGNNGDEVFVFAFLAKVIHSGLAHDFYYDYLPNFYPPLYFWVTGIVSRLFTTSGIVAAKIGVLGTFVVWFLGSYLWQWFYWCKIKANPHSKDFGARVNPAPKVSFVGGSKPPTATNSFVPPTSSTTTPKTLAWWSKAFFWCGVNQDKNLFASFWFFALVPAVFFLMLDFDAIILKPFEAVSALFCVLFVGMLAKSLNDKRWNYGQYLFFGISGGLLFLCFYFWWFALIPVLLYLILKSHNKKVGFIRVLIFGSIIVMISLPYLLPWVLSLMRFGVENWQAVFFMPSQLFSFIPWSIWSLKTVFFVLGIIGLLVGSVGHRRNNFVRSNLAIIIACYIYQLVNILFFLGGAKTWQPDKHFLFLGSAVFAVGASYSMILIYKYYITRLNPRAEKLALVVFLLIVVLPLMPYGKFIEEPLVLYQIEKDLNPPQIKVLADFIETNITDYKDRTWLTSGTPDLNAYLPISYYIAYNPHFSHQASRYSEKMMKIKMMVKAHDPQEFCDIIGGGYPRKIDGLILYDNKEVDYYPLFFWADNYPNGGREDSLKLPKSLVVEKYWDLVYAESSWKIYLKK
ncbi:MAG: hypothetical protein ABIJ91_00690 [Candidatus Kuenenbacteria bacterium]